MACRWGCHVCVVGLSGWNVFDTAAGQLATDIIRYIMQVTTNVKIEERKERRNKRRRGRGTSHRAHRGTARSHGPMVAWCSIKKNETKGECVCRSISREIFFLQSRFLASPLRSRHKIPNKTFAIRRRWLAAGILHFHLCVAQASHAISCVL